MDVPRVFCKEKIMLKSICNMQFCSLFTNSYADQFGRERNKKYKYKTFKNLLLKNAEFSMDNHKENIEFSFHEWKGKLEQVDDICILGLRI